MHIIIFSRLDDSTRELAENSRRLECKSPPIKSCPSSSASNNSSALARCRLVINGRDKAERRPQQVGAMLSPGPVPDDGRRRTPLYFLVAFLLSDAVISTLLLLPWVPFLRRVEGETAGYSLYGSLWDLYVLSALRILAALISLLRSYHVPPSAHFDPHHPNGEKKSREELEEEELEEPYSSWMGRYTSRNAFPCEVLGVFSALLIVAKCFARLDVEIGVFGDSEPCHPLFWVALFVTAVVSVIEALFLEGAGQVAWELGSRARAEANGHPSLMARIGSSNLLQPLLAHSPGGDNESESGGDEESPSDSGDEQQQERDSADSGIGEDANYKAGWTDLLGVCLPDLHLMFWAFVFLLFAATAQIYVPHYTGKVLDAVTEAYEDTLNDDDPSSSGEGVWSIPGFVSNIKKLVIASILGGFFSGLRGGVFTVVGGRVNVRLRVLLMDSLLCQDIGFFDTTKTGNISSRLTSDTTLVGDQVTLNVNVFLRSLVQAMGVLIFMFFISWQLSLLAFISVPLITILSKWYGHYIRRLTKLMQKKLADSNSVSVAVLSSMTTVRAFGAETSELREFASHCERYLALNLKSAIAYWGYAGCVTSLPQLVIAVVLFYGGLLVRSNGPDHITAGQLVTFLLYLTSLSDAFNSIGSIFASLTQAVGAADKVFELIHRKPMVKEPSANAIRDRQNEASDEIFDENLSRHGIRPKGILRHRRRGLHPPRCDGNITIDNVDMFYPARPKRKILSGLSLQAPPGRVVALVGPSGGGKSSIISLLQHLYEPSRGEVKIDNNLISDLSYEWLSENTSIVSQEPTLFARSIYRNIIFGLEGTRNEPSMEEVHEAAKLANAHSFIEALPMGYDADVGERGVQLSGGQKQRIAIARALVRKPRILLLDEATSALDAESEAAVQEAIDSMLTREKGRLGMTVLVIAHRLSTIRSADCIYVVEGGEVVENGSHAELADKKDGAYARLISKQMHAQKKLDGA